MYGLLILIILVVIWFCAQKPKIIYLDNAATTKPDISVVRAMEKFSNMGNASSDYAIGAKQIMYDTANLIGMRLSCHDPVIYTSGASESNCLFIRSIIDNYWMEFGRYAPVPNFIISSVEHKTSIICVEQLVKLGRVTSTIIEPKSDGTIDPIELSYIIKSNTIGVSIMHVNNETGAINDIESIGKVCKIKNIPLHIDMAQSFGKISTSMYPGISAISISFHKMHGPIGIGALVVTSKILDIISKVPQICGNQNLGARGGTENIPAIAGARASLLLHSNYKHVTGIRNYLVHNLQTNFANHIKILSSENSSPYICLVSFDVCNKKLKQYLQNHNILISIGSACNKNSSHVLTAMKLSPEIKRGAIRISLCKDSNLGEIDYLIYVLNKFYSDIK
jgi:cysteine desulfurase